MRAHLYVCEPGYYGNAEKVGQSWAKSFGTGSWDTGFPYSALGTTGMSKTPFQNSVWPYQLSHNATPGTALSHTWDRDKTLSHGPSVGQDPSQHGITWKVVWLNAKSKWRLGHTGCPMMPHWEPSCPTWDRDKRGTRTSQRGIVSQPMGHDSISKIESWPIGWDRNLPAGTEIKSCPTWDRTLGQDFCPCPMGQDPVPSPVPWDKTRLCPNRPQPM